MVAASTPLPETITVLDELRRDGVAQDKKKAAKPPLPLFDLPQRTETLDCPDIYAPHTITLIVNQPDTAFDNLTMNEALAVAIASWTLRLKGDKPAPITAESVGALPPDLYNWLQDEFVARRRRPLAERLKASPSPTE